MRKFRKSIMIADLPAKLILLFFMMSLFIFFQLLID